MTSLNESTEIQRIIDADKEIIMFANWMPITGNITKGDGLLIISDIAMYVMQYDTQCQLISRAKEYIVSTESVTFQEPDSLNFTFPNDRQIILKFPYPKDIMSIFITQLWQISIQNEFPQISESLSISFKQFHPKINIAKRFYAKSLTKNRTISTELYKNILHYFESKPNTVVISEINGVENFIDVLLFAIYPFDYIKKLVIDGETTNSYFRNISQNSEYLANIRTLVISATPDEYFPNCMQSLSNLTIERIEFRGLAIGKEHLDAISSYYLNSKCQFINFERISFDCRETEVNQFFTTLSSASSNRIIGLTTVRMDKRDELLNTFMRLKHLYLRGTGLNLSKIFKSLQGTNIVTADLSGSRCRKLLDPSIKLPSKLSKLIVNEISWTNRSLLALFTMVDNLSSQISLSISHATMTKDHWTSFFGEKVSMKNIQAFTWNDNPINQAFVKNICKSQVKYLSVGGNLEGGSANDFFQCSNNIEFLDISGYGDKKVCNSVIETVISAAKSKRVKYIDFSGNNIGDSKFGTLIPFISRFDGFLMDKNSILDPKSYSQLQTEFQKRQMQIPTIAPIFDYYKSPKGVLGKVPDFKGKFHLKFETRSFPEQSSVAAADFKDRIKSENKTGVIEDAKSVMMIPAPLSDYMPLVKERELRLEDDPVETDKWALDLVEIPANEFDKLKSSIMAELNFDNLKKNLMEIAQ